MENPITDCTSPFITLYPFGMITLGRSWDVGSGYRYGFNGMEGDDEIAGNDNALDFGARIYDARLGRWLSLDPLAVKYPEFSAYIYSGNCPITFEDNEGKSLFIYFETGKYDDSGNPIYDRYQYGSGLEVPDNEFVIESIAALDQIMAVDLVTYEVSGKNPTPSDVLTRITNDPNVIVNLHQISDNNNRHVPFGSNETDIYWNPLSGRMYLNYAEDKRTATVSAYAPPSAALSHELKHAYNFLYNIGDFFKNIGKKTLVDESTANNRTIPNDEEAYTTLTYDSGGFLDYYCLGNRVSYGYKSYPVNASTSTEEVVLDNTPLTSGEQINLNIKTNEL